MKRKPYREPINWDLIMERVAYGVIWMILSVGIMGGAALLWITYGPGLRK